MTIRYRRIYNEYELALLYKKLNILIEDKIAEYVIPFDVDDIVYGDATKKVILVNDLLHTELQNGLELAQVGGLMPCEAYQLAKEGIYDLFCSLQYEETLLRIEKDK